MRSVLLYIRRMTESRPRWTRVRDLLFTFGLAVLICGVIAVQRSRAQGTDQNSNAEGPAQTSAQNTEAQAPPASGSDAQGTDQSSNAEGPAQTAAPNGETQAPPSSGSGAQGTGQSSNAESCLQACAQSSNAESCLQACAQSSEAEGTAPVGGATASSAQSGQARPPTQSSGPPATGTRVTPTGKGAETHQAQPREIQQRSPYGNMPSLQGLYTQIPSTGGRLQRFGSDAFLLGTGNANELPMDLPAGPDYVLGPGDSLIVNMWGGQSSRLERIDRPPRPD